MKLFQKILNGITVFLLFTLAIGFFATDFEQYKPKIVTEETRIEKQYIEEVGLKIKKVSDVAVELKKANDQSARGEIVPLKLANIYQNSLTTLEALYKEVSAMDVEGKVPERFGVLHTTFTKTIELLGSAVNEIVTYTQDRQESHLTNSEKLFTEFYSKFDESIKLYNQLVFEK